MKQFARGLRKNQTDAEALLWSRLRNRQLAGRKFRRQVPIQGFVVDFACLDSRVIVELDGSQHGERVPYDERRTRELEACGFIVLRFWNIDVLHNLDAVLDMIADTVEPDTNSQ
ncbi:MAG: endonuclease domain-containing protein [Hyphomicrobiales bacterium]